MKNPFAGKETKKEEAMEKKMMKSSSKMKGMAMPMKKMMQGRGKKK